MKIEKLKIKSFGPIQNLESLIISDTIAWCGRNAEHVLMAISMLTGLVTTTQNDSVMVNANTEIEAFINLSGINYIVRIKQNIKRKGTLLTAVYANLGTDCTDEYLQSIHLAADEKKVHIFCGSAKCDYPVKLVKYKHPDDWFTRDSFYKNTDMMGKTSAFRTYTSSYINNFTAQKLRAEKDFLLYINPDGEFKVSDTLIGSDTNPCLSESETMLYKYLCFINLLEFWKGFEQIRNLHFENMPIIISDFIEHLDCSINIKDLISRTEKIGCQTHIALPIKSEMRRLNRKVQFINTEESGR